MTRSRLVVPPGRQGPGRMAPQAVGVLDLAFARRASGALPGEHRTPGVGLGTELVQIRPYEPGDDPRHLDPAASARTATLHVRRHAPERALTTWLLLDVSASMAFGTSAQLKSDVAEGVAAVIARLAVRRGGRIAVLTCGEPVTRILPPRGGRGALAAVQRLVAEGVAPDALPDTRSLADALARLRRLARQRGLVVVVSDFRDSGPWQRELRALAGRHAVVAIEVRDAREGSLPAAGALVLVDPETGRQVEADTGSPELRRRFEQAERERRARLAADLRRTGASHVALDTGGEWLRGLARSLR